MTDEEVYSIITKLRKFCYESRNDESSNNKMSTFFLNVIDMCCCVTELGIVEKRQISKNEEKWFNGSYHMNFWNSDIESELYTPLCREVERRNWFRKNLLQKITDKF